MTETDDIDMTAAEYALGTLDMAERAAVDERRHHDRALSAAIEDWERRLAPLLANVAEVAPPDRLLPMIEQRLGPRAVPQASPRAGHISAASERNVVVLLQKRLARWRTGAVAASALAACLAGAIVVRETLYPPIPRNVVGVFQTVDGKPSFLLSIDLATRQVLIRPVTAERHPDKAYQLWIVSEKLGPGPQSLGLLDSVSQPTRKRLDHLDADLLSRATFGISVEPPGGSPTGKPTGPALHSKLYPTTL